MDTEKLKYKMMSGFLKGVAHMPLRLMYGFSDFARFILHRVIRYRVTVVRKNLHLAFPEKSEKERRKIENDFYRHLCDIFVEAAKLAHVSDEEMARRITVEGIEHVNDAIARGKSVVLMLGHYGNWEWVTYSATQMPAEVITSEIYRPLRDKVMDDVMLDLRTRFGTENISNTNAIRRLLGIHKEGKQFVCGFISDQRPLYSHLKNWTEFLGINTAYMVGGEAIGTKLGCEFVYVEMRPEKRGHYKMVLSPLKPLDDGEENPYTRAFLKALEGSIRRNPPYWLWSHNRWRDTPGAGGTIGI